MVLTTKVTALLDAEECWEIVNGTETELGHVAPIAAADNALALVNQVTVDSRRGEIKEFRKRFKKAASLIAHTVDDSIVMSLDVHLRNPIAMWKQPANDFNTVTLAQLKVARREFENLAFTGSETSLEMKQNFNCEVCCNIFVY